MRYSAEISRQNPSCFLFLIDQSGSMLDIMTPNEIRSLTEPKVLDGKTFLTTGEGFSKAEGVANALNHMLQNLSIKCAKSEGVLDYYSVGVIGYGGHNTDYKVGSAWTGSLSGRDMVPISDVANHPARIEEQMRDIDYGGDQLVQQTVKVPVWVEPDAEGATPMCQAIEQARGLLSAWIEEHPDSFPPIVINITDGEATDGNPLAAASALKSLETRDGNVLLFNIHISGAASEPIEFADSDENLPDDFAEQLFNMSSPLPAYMQIAAKREGFDASEFTRGFVFNGDLVSVIRFLDIGTRPSNLV